MSELNLSNISCEYFYDEEYDLEEPSFSNNNLYSSNTTSNNNNNYSNNNMSFGDQSRDSEFWAESILQASGNNNNITNSYLFEKNFRTITKCLSTDQVMDNSYLNETPSDGNYQLFFDNNKTNLFDSNENIKMENVKRHLFRKCGSKFFVDSGKGSATTCDSMVPPITRKLHRKNIIKSEEERISEASIKKRSTLKKKYNKKRSVTLWRQFKKIFSEWHMKWSETSHKIHEINAFSRSYSMPTLTVYNIPFFSDVNNDEINELNRYSTTILDVYNYSLNFSKSYDEDILYNSQSVRNSSDFSSQFPENRHQQSEVKCKESVKIVKQRKKKHVFKLPRVVDYPRLGKIIMPVGLRTPISEMFRDEKMCGKLEFLGNTANVIKRSQSSTGRSLREGVAQLPTERNACKRSNSESRPIPQPLPSKNLSKFGSNRPQPIITQQQQFLTPVVEEVVRSVSFADLRPIPRRKVTVASTCDDDIMAIFNIPAANAVNNDTQQTPTNNDGRKDSFNRNPPSVIPELNSEEELNNRIAGLVNSTLESIKRLSVALNDMPDDLGTLCDKFVRCKDSRRDSTVSLMTVVDSILALMSDGLCVTNKKPRSSISMINNKNRASEDDSAKEKRKRGQIAQKLWIFVEESCRGAIKEPSQKMALGAMMKQVKQIQIAGSNREVVYQMRLQLFITVAIKKSLLSIWLRAVVTNESILNRFFSPNSFLRQARTVLSNALAAVIVEIRNLCTNNLATNHVTTKHASKKGDKQGASRVTKPVSIRSGRSRQIRTAPPLPNRQSSNGSQNNRPVAVGIQRRTRNNNSSGHRSQSKTLSSRSRDRLTAANQNCSSGRGGSKSRIPVFIG